MRTILFVCIGNASRSQMAEGFFSNIKKDDWCALSAGTNPANELPPKTIEAMAEVNIDISKQKPKKLTTKMVKNADIIVTLGCLNHETCPSFLLEDKEKLIDWQIEDPYGKSYERLKEIRDQVREKVRYLINSGKLG